MIYYILGILAIVIVHLVTFLKSYENEKKVNFLHIAVSGLVSLYMVYITKQMHDNIIGTGPELLKITAYFIPLGVFMPLIYRRFKSFMMEVAFSAFFMGVIFVLQIINCGDINATALLFAIFGMLLGYSLCIFINVCIPLLRESLIIKKRKKQSIYFSFEPEVFSVIMFALFFAVAGIEGISGQDIEKTIKDATVNNIVKKDKDKVPGKYSGIYYADKDKVSRYDDYSTLHPDMSLEEVVWRVDANLDREFYDEEYVKIADEESASPLLINKFNRVSEYYKPKTLVKIEGQYLSTPATAEAYHDMTEKMKELGMTIYVVSSYRDIAYQKNLYNGYLRTDSKEEVDSYSSRPGFSEHHTGRALDISNVYNNLNVFEGSKEAEWIYEHCHEYGFIVRYKEGQTDVTGYIFEPWHIVYVGKDIAQTMHDEGIESLEEYVVKYIDHKKK